MLSLLNTEAKHLGLEAISLRALEDWISEDYLEGPDPKGRQRGVNPDWQYTAEAAERGLAVVRLRAAKTKRATATRLRLFLNGFDVPPGRTKLDLRSEFSRLLKRHLFRRPWEYQARKDATGAEKAKQLQRGGEVDPVLKAAGVKAPDQTILDAGSSFVWGIPGPHSLLPTLINILGNIPILTDEIRRGLIEDIKPYVEIFGLLGDPEEIERSGLEDLKRCSTEDIEQGREFYRATVNLFEVAVHLTKLSRSDGSPKMLAAVERVAKSIREGDEWCTTIFAAGAVAAFRRRQGDI